MSAMLVIIFNTYAHTHTLFKFLILLINMTWPQEKKIDYLYVKNYLEQNGKTEFKKLKAKIKVQTGCSNKRAIEMIRDLLESEEINKEKQDDKVILFLSH